MSLHMAQWCTIELSGVYPPSPFATLKTIKQNRTKLNFLTTVSPSCFQNLFFFLCLSLRLFLSLLPPSAEQQRNDCWVTVSTNSLWVRESPRILAQSFLTIHSSQLPPSLTSRLSGRTSADVLRHFFRPPGHSVPCTLFLPFFFFTSCYYCTYWIVSGASLHSLHLGFCLDW